MGELTIYGETFNSRLLMGSALYPSLDVMRDAIATSGSEIVTLSLRRQSPEDKAGQDFWQYIQSLGVRLLPNTAGCHSAKEATALAQMSRELFQTNWIKLEVIGDEYTLQPDPVELLKATETLLNEGFKVLPYCTDDLVLCKRLADLGCEVIMPWGAPIGTGRGLLNPSVLAGIRNRLSDVTLIIDAGIGLPSHAAQALELGYDAVLLNSAVALASDPVMMAKAFKLALQAGRHAFVAGSMPQKDVASPSTPTLGMPFWHQESL